jgi:hypothetical protein
MSDSSGKKSFIPSVAVFAAVLISAFIVYRVWQGHVPASIAFKPISGPAFAGVVGWLFAVALFVERAVEVIVMVFRDQDADLLDNAEAEAKDAFTAATDPATKQAAQTALSAAHEAVIIYRAHTKEFALQVGFFLGALVALAGVRALHGLIPDNIVTGRWFTLVDIIVTSAMLAGGSEGIHRLVNVFTSFTDGVSRQLDQKNPPPRLPTPPPGTPTP